MNTNPFEQVLKISRDGGETWNEELIDISDIKVGSCKLQNGDLVERDGVVYRAQYTVQLKKINTNNVVSFESKKNGV